MTKEELLKIKVSITDVDVLRSVPLQSVKRWLEKKSRKVTKPHGYNGKCLVYALVDLPYRIEVPTNSEFRDYALRMAEILELLCNAYGRSQLAIYEEMMSV